jgi:uncharacterized protein (DUF305 family)
VSRSRALITASSLTLAVLLAACGGGGGSAGGSTTSGATGSAVSSAGASEASSTYSPVTPGPAAKGAHNDTDVMFANDMIPHHGQAVTMADLILARSANAQVKALAENIKRAQTPEIATMSGWLKGWGSAVPDPYGHAAGMTGMSQGGKTGMSQGGMMSDAQLKQLSEATGPAADKSFLSLMVEHHQGAIDMANGELREGVNPEAKRLAQSIVTSQTAEIAQMKSLLASMP